MLKSAVASTYVLVVVGIASAADISLENLHEQFTGAFNERDWDRVGSLMADDAVFHRANSETVYVGRDAILDRFSDTIGAPDQWNVKITTLDSEAQFQGDDGRVVERGEFAITAGPEDDSCYRGSYMITWTGGAEADWKIQSLAWQDVETGMENCG